jgi:ABC-type glycerol-3-phosphate transport system substrate-binding protein
MASLPGKDALHKASGRCDIPGAEKKPIQYRFKAVLSMVLCHTNHKRSISMKMKAVAVLLSLCLVFGVITGAFAAPGDAVLFQAAADGMNENSVQSIAAVGDTLYLLAQNGLYAWQAKDAEPRLISNAVVMGYASGNWKDMPKEDQERNKNSVNYLLERDGKLYGLNTVKGALLLLTVTADGVSFSEEAVLDWESMFVQEADYTYSRQIFGAALTSDRLYLLVQQPTDNWNDYDMLSFDLATGAQTKVAVENVHAIARYENGQLLCNVYDWENSYSSDGKPILPVLSVLDPTTQSLTKLTDFPAAQVGGLSYSSESGMVYALGRGELYGCKPGSAFETIAYMPVDYPGDQMPSAVLSGGLYAAIPNYGSVYVRNTDPALKPNRVLRISGGNSDNVTKAFQAAHPELPVVFKDEFYTGAEQITQQMVSGSDSADLFIISLSYGGFSSLRDKGYVSDLSGSAILMEAVSKMYPQYVKDIFKDGKLIAFPCRFNGYGLGYSPDILKELGIEQPPKTLPELMDLYVDWVDEYSQKFTGYTLMENIFDIRMELLNNILMTYLAHYGRTGEDLKFDTPVFKSLLAKLDEVSPILEELNPSQEEQQGSTVVYSNGYENKPTSLISTYFNFYPAEYYEDRGYLPLPLALDEGMDPAMFAQIEVFVINPNSPNQDLAKTYLEFFAQNMPRDYSITFCPDDNTPVENPSYAREMEDITKNIDDIKAQMKTASPDAMKSLEESLKNMEDYLAYREKSRFSIPEKVITQYRELVPYVCVDSEYMNFLTSSQEAVKLLQRFMQGEMKTEQFVKEFDRKLQMMRMENN